MLTTKLKAKISGQSFHFRDMKELLAKASSPKSGDNLAGISAGSLVERVAARAVLSEVSLNELRLNPVVPFDSDELSRMVDESLDGGAFERVKGFSVGSFREWLLQPETTGEDISAISFGLTGEMAAAVCKLMSNLDLMIVSKKIAVPVKANNTMGLLDRLASRVQPNHPTDDVQGILYSAMEGLAYGCGDAVIGVNPATDTPESTADILNHLKELIGKHRVPTQTCVLSHVTVQMKALELGCSSMDLMFQSLAGTEAGNKAFGIDIKLIDEAYAMMQDKSSAEGPNVMYFETGQGSELSSAAHEGADQLTLEARCYTFARRYKPFLVNTVVGFIGPEYLANGPQITRAGLEDHFLGKLLGLPMGCDACFTYHADMSQDELESLKVLLANAGCSYLMSMPVGDDIMLNYQSTSYHDIQTIRTITGKRPVPEFESWLAEQEIIIDNKIASNYGKTERFL